VTRRKFWFKNLLFEDVQFFHEHIKDMKHNNTHRTAPDTVACVMQ
jgi:hypothetical protein